MTAVLSIPFKHSGISVYEVLQTNPDHPLTICKSQNNSHNYVHNVENKYMHKPCTNVCMNLYRKKLTGSLTVTFPSVTTQFITTRTCTIE